MKTIKIGLVALAGLWSMSTQAQRIIEDNRAIQIKADIDNSNGLHGTYEGIQFYTAGSKLFQLSPNYVTAYEPFVSNETAILKKDATIKGALNVEGNAEFSTRIGLGTSNPAVGFHVISKDIRVDGGQFQSNGMVILHPDVDNTGNDVVSFRNSTNQEMARMHDGVLTLKGGNTIQSTGALTLRPDISNSGDDYISFKDGSNQEMARLQDGRLTLDQVRINVSTFPDYVFSKEYKRMPLLKVAEFVKKYKHLPNMPSEKEVVANGMDVGQINIKLVEKVEELTLYTIEQEQKIESLSKRLAALEKMLNTKN